MFNEPEQLFARLRKHEEIEHSRALAAHYKQVDWEGLSIPSVDRRALQSFRDRVKHGVRIFPLVTEDQINPLLERLGISVHFAPVYESLNLDGPLFEGSKLSPSDFATPSGVAVDMGADDYVKLANLHFW